MRDRLTPGGEACGHDAAGPEDVVMPWWTAAVCLGIVAPVAAAGVVQLGGDHQLEVAAILALAVSPWVVALVARTELPSWAYSVPALGALAVVHVGGPKWGWVPDDRIPADGLTGANDQLSIFVGVWLVGQVAAMGSRRAGILTWLGMAAVLGGRALTDPHFDAVVVWLAGCTVALACGTLIRMLIVTVQELHATQAQLATDAAREERQRIAREVHDVVAHSMTVTMLHLTAARLAVRRGDADAAVEALEEAERAGRASLADIRTTVDLLRDQPPSSDEVLGVPAPSTVDVDELVASWRAAGVDVGLEVTGDLSALGPTAGLVVYRTVQESLANAARHRPGSVSRVEVAASADGARVTVSTTGGRPASGPSAGPGRGLVGMRERVEALGGSLEAGPSADGWLVVVRLPGSVTADLVP